MIDLIYELAELDLRKKKKKKQDDLSYFKHEAQKIIKEMEKWKSKWK